MRLTCEDDFERFVAGPERALPEESLSPLSIEMLRSGSRSEPSEHAKLTVDPLLRKYQD